jgi:hypothetical protein
MKVSLALYPVVVVALLTVVPRCRARVRSTFTIRLNALSPAPEAISDKIDLIMRTAVIAAQDDGVVDASPGSSDAIDAVSFSTPLVPTGSVQPDVQYQPGTIGSPCRPEYSA